MSAEALQKAKQWFDEELAKNVAIVLARWKTLHTNSTQLNKLKTYLMERKQASSED